MIAAAILLVATAVPAMPHDPAMPNDPAAPGSAWRTLAPGLEFALLDGGSGCRRGDCHVAVVRAEPASWRPALHHALEEPGGGGGLDAAAWQARTRAPVVINAGQYYPDRRPMGLFVKDGRNWGTKLIKAWKAILAADPAPAAGQGVAGTVLLDLDFDAFDASTTPYRVVLQSFMLLDRAGKKRVRRSEWQANRTVIATDQDGRLLLVTTPGAWTLWELADWLARTPALSVRHAMALDGGFEAQMVVRAAGFAYESFGAYHVDDTGDHSIPGLRVRLPGVVVLNRRD